MSKGKKIKKPVFPRLKKKVWWFLTDESGKITKSDALGLAVWVVFFASASDVLSHHTPNSGGAHENHSSHNVATTPHANTNRHWSSGAHGSASKHGSTDNHWNANLHWSSDSHWSSASNHWSGINTAHSSGIINGHLSHVPDGGTTNNHWSTDSHGSSTGHGNTDRHGNSNVHGSRNQWLLADRHWSLYADKHSSHDSHWSHGSHWSHWSHWSHANHCSWHASSDERLKKNIKQIDKTLEKLNEIKAYKYDFILDSLSNWNTNIWFLAQEIEKVFPDLVSTDENDGYKKVNYFWMIAVLLQTVKELNEKIDIISNSNNKNRD